NSRGAPVRGDSGGARATIASTPPFEGPAQAAQPLAGARETRQAQVDAALFAQAPAQAHARADHLQRMKAFGQQRPPVVERPFAGRADPLGVAAVRGSVGA